MTSLHFSPYKRLLQEAAVDNWIESKLDGDFTDKPIWGISHGNLVATGAGTPSGIFDTVVAVGVGPEIQTSRDGALLSHMDADAAYAGDFFGVAFSPPDNSCVLVGTGGEIQKLSDLSDGPVRKKTGVKGLLGVAYGDGRLVTVGRAEHTGAAIFSSDDYGEIWTPRTPGGGSLDAHFNRIAYGNSRFVVAATEEIQMSLNGADWQNIDLSSLKDDPTDMIFTFSVVYGNGYFLIGGMYMDMVGGVFLPMIFRSTDGINWEKINLPLIPYESVVLGLAYMDGIFVAGTENAGYLLVSYDNGTTWSIQPCNLPNVSVVGPGKGTFLLSGQDAATVAHVFRSLKVS